MTRKSLNIVNEIISHSINGRPSRVGPSPLLGTPCGRLKQHLLSFQCTANNEYEFVDSLATEARHPPIYTCSFGGDAKTGHLLAIGGEDGHIAIIDSNEKTSNTTITPSSVHNVHQNAVMDLSWVPGSEDIVTGGGDKAAVVWQLRAGRLHPVLKLLGHTRSVKAVAVNPYDPAVFATGSRDSNIIVWDRRCSPSNRADEIVPAHPSQAASSVASPRYRRRGNAGSEQAGPNCVTPGGGTMALNNGVTSLLFTDQYTLLSAGASDGLIKVWDMRKSHCLVRSAPLPQHTLQQPHTSSKLGFSWLTAPKHSQYVYALAMDKNIYAYHLAEPNTTPVAVYSGCLNLSYYVKAAASPCGRYLVAGSTDNRALMWLTEQPGAPIAMLNGFHGEVAAVDWGQYGQDKIAACADDLKQKIFYVRRTDPDNMDENLQIKGSAEPIDTEIRQRCRRTSVELNKYKAPAQDDRPTTNSVHHGSMPPIPKTPSSSSRSSSTIANLLLTPLRQNITATTDNTPCRTATTPMQHGNTLQADYSSITTPLRASSDQHLQQAVSASHGLVRRTLLSTPRQGRDPAPSPLSVASAGRPTAGLDTPQTPSSVDRSLTLLQWLSSAKKTPGGRSVAADATPRQPLQSGGCVSASKRAGIKRKLTEVMEETNEEVENVVPGGSSGGGERPAKKSPVSPNLNVLFNITNDDLINLPSSAAKMLKYEKNEEKDNKESSELDPQLERVLGIGDSVQPFEPSMLDTLRNSSFRSSFGESKSASGDDRLNTTNDNDSNNLLLGNITNESANVTSRMLPTIPEEVQPTVEKYIHKSRFESPTANLPNFVVDGMSPRARPVPVFREKPNTNWLSSIAQQRKQRVLDSTPDKIVVPSTTSAKKKKRKTCMKSSASKAMKKKYLKIVALCDSPMGEASKRTPKGTQTKLNFRQ